MTASRVLPIAAAAALLALLLFALLFLLLNRGGTAAVELTGEDLVTTVAAAGIEPTPLPAAAGDGAAAPLRVYVAGAVQKPGVYTLNPGDRLADAVAAAGGIAATADLAPVNLALKVQDEGRYLIPDIATRPNQAAAALPPAAAADLTRKTANLLTGELSGVTESGDSADKDPTTGNAAGNGGVIGGGDIPVSAANSGGGITVSAIGLLDLNTATDRQLETLPGIGPSRARAIIAHRNQHGPFVAAEELTAVAGIGPGIYGNLQSLVSVAPTPAP